MGELGTDMTRDEESSLPPPVYVAILAAYALALALVVFGFIGFLISNALDDSVGVGAFLLGLIVAGAAYAASRGSSLGRAFIGLGSAATAVAGVIYALTGPSSAVIPCLLMAALGAGTFALLYLTDAARRFYSTN
jgi:uncharacterized membrane protein (UPF0136 family)